MQLRLVPGQLPDTGHGDVYFILVILGNRVYETWTFGRVQQRYYLLLVKLSEIQN